MATIRKRGSRYNVQIRKEGYPSITKTFTRISIARKWANSIEADMERRLYIEVPDSCFSGTLTRAIKIELRTPSDLQKII